MKTISKQPTMFEAWITKYGLTSGILKTVGHTCGSIDVDMFSYKQENGSSNSVFRNEWFRTEEEAIARVEEMRLKKIASLEKNIDKMKNFKVKII